VGDADGNDPVNAESRVDEISLELRDVRTQVALARARLEAIASLADRLSGLEARIDRIDGAPGSAELEALVARVDAQEREIRELREQLRERGVLLEKVLAYLPSVDMRREPRFSFDETVRVTLVTERERPAAGRVVNVSNKGLGLVLGDDLPVGAEVEADINEVLVRGRIVHSRREGDRFAVGVSLDQPIARSLS